MSSIFVYFKVQFIKLYLKKLYSYLINDLRSLETINLYELTEIL